MPLHPHPPPRPRRIQLRQQISPRLEPSRRLPDIPHHHRRALAIPAPATRPAAGLGQVPQRTLHPPPEHVRVRERLDGQPAAPDPAAERILAVPELAVDQPRRRDPQVVGIGVQHEHQPVQPRLSRRVKLQLGDHTSGLSRTGEPYRVPRIPTYTSHPRTRSTHSCAAGRSAAGKSAMSTITCPAAEIARSAAATYDIPFGNFRSSEVCERNTRHPPISPGPSKAGTRVTPSLGNTLKPASHPSQ